MSGNKTRCCGWNFTIECGGEWVAAGSAPDEETARREAMHYAMQYSRDGVVKVRLRRQRLRFGPHPSLSRRA